MIVEIVLVFDTSDIEDNGLEVLNEIMFMEDIKKYAEECNLETARAMTRYQGYQIKAYDYIMA